MKYPIMVKRLMFIVLLGIYSSNVFSQCSMCTKTAASLDDKSAKGLNNGIIYLAALPLVMMGFIGFKWWKQNRD